MAQLPVDWRPTRLDLALSAAMALLFPLVAGALLSRVGALLPMALYYGAAWGLVLWRRGGSGYRLDSLPPPPAAFHVNLGVILATLLFAYLARIEVASPSLPGVLATAVLWATANASSEQLLWLYIFDSWDLYGVERAGRARSFALRAAALLLFSAFVGLVHLRFWARFLRTVDAATFPGALFVAASTVSGYLHIAVRRRSGRMAYTSIPHFLLNLAPLFWTGYSILPFLFAPLR